MGHGQHLKTCIAVVAIYAVTPLGGELVEGILHMVTATTALHLVPDAKHDAESPERNCTGPFHTCACHQGPPFVMTRSDVGQVFRPLCAGGPAEAERAPADGHLQRIFRPPRRS